MTMKTKSIRAATAALLLVAGLSAKATLTPGADYTATLINPSTSTSFTLNSEYFLPTGSGTFGSDYTYGYWFSGVDDPLGLSALTVYFDSALVGVIGQGASVSGTTPVIPNGANWQFNPYTDTANLWFYSPVGPTIGSAAALDNGTWGPASGVVVPNVPSVPDGGLTLTLLGGTLLGLGALRRKLGC
jgi:hypothetical protein